MLKRILFPVIAVSLSLSLSATAAVMTNESAPDFTLNDSNGQSVSLTDFKGKYVVLEWVNYECPFVKKHYKTDNMQTLQKDVTDKGVIWLSINSSAVGKQGYFMPAEINEIMENSQASPTAYLIDTSGEVGKMYGAKTTPHMYVIDPQGQLVYQGAIDDMPTFDPNDVPKANNYVQMALNAAMSGNKIEAATTTPYGCSVKY